jgi:probable HAF family extracellular repeat protein
MELGSGLQAPAQMIDRPSDKRFGLLRALDSFDESVKISSSERKRSKVVGNDQMRRPHDGTKDLQHPNLDLSVSNLQTVPFWTDTFDYRGLRYTFHMVGTDPKRGSATTVIPTEIIPIRWVFSNGMVIDASTDIVDGQTPVQGIINSPVFQDYDFTSGGTHLGNTQFGDAFQRANFWDSVSTRSPNYHVRLGAPTIMPTQTIVVPDDKVHFPSPTPSGYVIPEIDADFLHNLDLQLHGNLAISPDTLPLIVWGSVGVIGGALGYHGVYPAGNSLQTFISVAYLPNEAYGYIGDVAPVSHEIIEWMDDPFGNNYSAGWNDPFYSVDFPPPARARCQSAPFDYLETADPFERLGAFAYTSVPLDGFTYHFAEGAFIDFFTRSSRSRSVNGQYSFFEIARPYGLDTPPAPDCVGSLHTDNQFFAVPGSVSTSAYGMNNTGEVVGAYFYADGLRHGYKKDRFGYRGLDFPGALHTVLRDINDAGTIVGYYLNDDGFPHGFMFKNGRFTTIDFPGSTDTFPEKINSGGVIVGMYDLTQPITHGFLFDGRRYQAVDSPLGQQTEAASINDGGTIAGNSWSSLTGPQHGFLQTRNVFTQFDFPDQTLTFLTSINSFGDLGGFYLDSGLVTPFVRLLGYPYVVSQLSTEEFIFDINDNRETLGLAYNFATGRRQPYVGHPPFAARN